MSGAFGRLFGLSERISCLDYLLSQPHTWCQIDEIRESWHFGWDVRPDDALQKLVEMGFIKESTNERNIFVYQINICNPIVQSILKFEYKK